MKKNVKYVNDKKVTFVKEPEVNYNDDILPEYDFSKARPFRERLEHNRILIELEPEVARYFPTSKQVNITLKAIIRALKKTKLVNN